MQHLVRRIPGHRHIRPALIEGATDVKLFGEEIHVNAEIIRLPGISGHADNQGLMKWAAAFKEKPQRVFVAHGDDQVCDLFAERLKQELGYSAVHSLQRHSGGPSH